MEGAKWGLAAIAPIQIGLPATRGGTVTHASFDLGAAWIPQAHPNFQLDGGVNLGLNNQTPAAQAFVGISQRF
jgi:hypothetical protein